METILNEAELRVLGALVEKQVTTPEYYPLTLNALVQACNQKNNRHPVVNYDEQIVSQAIETLRAKNLVYVFYGSNSRVPKYKHMMMEVFGIDSKELALMCVLMLRGPQTPGELRGRAERLYDFSSLDEVEDTLTSLIEKEPQALALKLARQSGQKEIRYAHLLAGDISADYQSASFEQEQRPAGKAAAEPGRLHALEQEVETLRAELGGLRREFEEFKKQFD
ncbi:MAG TPA: YceH family protein [Pyrinomonadaceae bacterium]|jgi:uncharacterized protein YceH (UPF0502 family)